MNKKIPNNWLELKSLLDYISECPPDFLRLPEDETFYRLFRDLVPRNIALEIVNRQIGKNDYAIVKNNFPYSKVLSKINVVHYCLWSRKGSLNKKQIEQKVKEKFGNCTWCFSERKPGKKSVPEIWHCHIFVKKSKSI